MQQQDAEGLANKEASYPLLLAARRGDVAEINKLIAAGQKVNQADRFGTTALHLAAMYDHLDAVNLLLQKGAKVNATTYEENYGFEYTALDLAVHYGSNLKVIDALVHKGATSEHLYDLMLDLFDTVLETNFTQNYTQFDLALSKVELLALNIPEAKVIDDGYESIPTSLLAQVYSTEGIAEPKYFQRIAATADLLLKHDTEGLAHKYVLAKDLLHAFPSEHTYAFIAGEDVLVIEAQGHFSRYSINCAHEALAAFSETLKHGDTKEYQQLAKNYIDETMFASFDAYNLAKQAVFENVTYTFETAVKTAQMAWLHETSENLFQDYMAGKTILLPTGWIGHAIDIIIDKNHDLLMIANSGERHDSVPEGLNAYHLNFDLTANDIYDILTNENRMDLEFKSFYDWGLTEYPEFSFSIPNQEYGNCAWYSQTIAEQALLFLDLKKSVSQDCALTLSETWFEQLNDYQQTKILKDYLAAPTLEVEAMGDILVSYHNRLKTPAEIERAHLILDIMSEPENKNDFATYCKQHQKDFSKELKNLIKTYGFKVKGDFDKEALSLDDVLDNESNNLFDCEEKAMIAQVESHEDREVLVVTPMLAETELQPVQFII